MLRPLTDGQVLVVAADGHGRDPLGALHSLDKAVGFSLRVVKDNVVPANECNLILIDSKQAWIDLWVHTEELPKEKLL